ncbi:MAG: lytic polysaccharide monooxygenase auxiliary activity family 9 protein [Candidatus Aquirickettsiella sp.]
MECITKKIKIEPRHGSVTTPQSRAVIYLPEWEANGLEAGKFFPARASGLSDPEFATDVKNNLPPLDGQIASAGKDFATILDEVKEDWYKHKVQSGQKITFTWHFAAKHKSRRYNYFMTRANWDPTAKLSRAQFENSPFVSFEEKCQPYWDCEDLIPTDPTQHLFTLPIRSGYQVLLAIWEVADTGNGFYQVVDLLFA